MITVDWSAGADTINYITARNRVSEAGAVVASFIDFLNEHGGLRFQDLNIIGHSLGWVQKSEMIFNSHKRRCFQLILKLFPFCFLSFKKSLVGFKCLSNILQRSSCWFDRKIRYPGKSSSNYFTWSSRLVNQLSEIPRNLFVFSKKVLCSVLTILTAELHLPMRFMSRLF